MSLKQQREMIKEVRALTKKYKSRKDILDIQLGYKRVSGEVTTDLSIRFQVAEKKDEKSLKRTERIPKKIGRFWTDIIEHKDSRELARESDPNFFVSPLLGGIEVQSGLFNQRTDWGTMGCVLNIRNHLYGITNHHVVFGDDPLVEERPHLNRLKIFQPNRANLGEEIGLVTGPFNRNLDYCLFLVEKPVDNFQSINKLNGRITGAIEPRLDMHVFKYGATTKLTHGVVESVSAHAALLTISYLPHMNNDSQHISGKGDSGSAWVTEGEVFGELRLVGLHFQRNPSLNAASATPFTSIYKSIQQKLNQ